MKVVRLKKQQNGEQCIHLKYSVIIFCLYYNCTPLTQFYIPNIKHRAEQFNTQSLKWFYFHSKSHRINYIVETTNTFERTKQFHFLRKSYYLYLKYVLHWR